MWELNTKSIVICKSRKIHYNDRIMLIAISVIVH